MRCAKARSTWIERDLAPLSAGPEAALASHLAHCADCATWAGEATRLGFQLRGLRTDPPPAIDVTARVLEELTAVPTPRPEELRAGVLAWVSAAALTAAAGLTGALWNLGPSVGRTARAIWLTLSGLRPAAGALAEATLTLLAPAWRTLRHLGAAVHATATAGLSPTAYVLTCLAAIAVATTVTVVVGRDLRQHTTPREEHPR